jgi:acyl-CoA reductase-like NAD-dependent aldehyde dehydrogenase
MLTMWKSSPEAAEADVEWAVAAAPDCLENFDWASWSPAHRAAALHRFAYELDKRAADLSKSEVRQSRFTGLDVCEVKWPHISRA